MRDTIKDKSYFDDYVSLMHRLIKDGLNKLENNQVKIDRVPSVKYHLVKSYKSVLIAKYSRGDEMFLNEIALNLEEAYNLISEYWHSDHLLLIKKKEGKKRVAMQQYSLGGYFNLVELLSLGVLLNINKDKFNLIVDFIDNDNVKDFLFEFLINSNFEREPIDSESYVKYFDINKRFGMLKEIIAIEEKEIAEKKMKSFLEKSWFKSFKNQDVFGLHTNPHNVYRGYWCFAAAAIVKIKDLDDSSFRDNKYYPKDLI